ARAGGRARRPTASTPRASRPRGGDRSDRCPPEGSSGRAWLRPPGLAETAKPVPSQPSSIVSCWEGGHESRPRLTGGPDRAPLPAMRSRERDHRVAVALATLLVLAGAGRVGASPEPPAPRAVDELPRLVANFLQNARNELGRALG